MNILLSFPRSGNSLVRFFIERVSGKKTLDCGGSDNESILSLYKSSNNSSGQVIVRKSHFWKEVETYSSSDRRIILLLRDYKDCITSNIKRGGGTISESLSIYLESLEKFDQHKGDKILAYYEDFINDPKQLKPIAEFLNLDESKTQEFIDSYEEEKKISLDSYSAINGNLTGSGGKHTLSNKELEEFSSVKSHYLFDKYLKRYEH